MKLSLFLLCAKRISLTFMEGSAVVTHLAKVCRRDSCAAQPAAPCIALPLEESYRGSACPDFKAPPQTISDMRRRLFHLMAQRLAHLVSIPPRPQRFDSGPLKNAVVIDTTPTPVPHPHRKEDCKLYFNYKKKPTKFAMKTQIAVELDLKIWDVSNTYAARQRRVGGIKNCGNSIRWQTGFRWFCLSRKTLLQCPGQET